MLSVRSETSGGIRNVRIDKCKFTAAKTFAIYIKSRPGRSSDERSEGARPDSSACEPLPTALKRYRDTEPIGCIR
jgi:hypothetical protein